MDNDDVYCCSNSEPECTLNSWAVKNWNCLHMSKNYDSDHFITHCCTAEGLYLMSQLIGIAWPTTPQYVWWMMQSERSLSRGKKAWPRITSSCWCWNKIEHIKFCKKSWPKKNKSISTDNSSTDTNHAKNCFYELQRSLHVNMTGKSSVNKTFRFSYHKFHTGCIIICSVLYPTRSSHFGRTQTASNCWFSLITDSKIWHQFIYKR
jgi:hypothetical protein